MVQAPETRENHLCAMHRSKRVFFDQHKQLPTESHPISFPVIDKYLQSYAEPEAVAMQALPAHYSYALVIPAFKESSDFLQRLHRLEVTEKFLLVLIINQPDDLSVCAENDDLLHYIHHHYHYRWQQSDYPISLFEGLGFDILVVDRFKIGKKIPPKHGVGLARKIGADIVCKLMRLQCIRSPWIFTSDADAQLPDNYFKAAEKHQAAALVYAHQHIGEDQQALSPAGAIYESSLAYYVDGLRWAGSPYAYHSIGSCIAVNCLHYAQVRGFPKKAAGEDFYLLNKIRKTGSVVSLSSAVILLQARQSDRVPFGTGPALKKINLLDHIDTQFLFYHPWIFHYLRCWLNTLNGLWPQLGNKDQTEKILLADIKRHCQNNAHIDSEILITAVIHFDALRAIQQAQQHSKSEQVFRQHMMNWFDGFQTLKFIHYLREHVHPSLAWQQVIELEAPWIKSTILD
jgi:hypothetical protein